MAASLVDSSRNQKSSSHFSCDSQLCRTVDSLSSLFKSCRTPTVSRIIRKEFKENRTKKSEKDDDIWMKIREEALVDVEKEPALSQYYFSTILSHTTLESSLANQLAIKLCNAYLNSDSLYDIFLDVFVQDGEINEAIRDDLRAIKYRDLACSSISYVQCFLNVKGFLACQAYRVAHKLWSQGRVVLALVIQSRVSEVFAVDIHPGARIGRGIFLDHATGIVVGETAVIGDNVSIQHDVTLGGTGKVLGDRHPKIGDGVFIGSGTKVLGSFSIGDGAEISAGSVVLKEIPPKAVVFGKSC